MSSATEGRAGAGAAERLVFRGATVLDGTGAPRRVTDVAVAEGRITALGPAAAEETGDRVDASGLALAPGFIDMHAHSDLAVLRDPDHSAKLAQGVTLEVLGQDGLSYAPADPHTLDQVREAIAGWNGDGSDISFDWRDVGGYLDRLDRGIALNAAYLVPQGTVRATVCGWADRPATERELDAMRQLVAEGLQQGAVGLSSGLTYSPGMYASAAELTELCRVTAAHGGFYCPHHRSYGAGALAAYQEVVEICRAAGCALHLAHATMNFPVNAGRAPQLLELLDRAAADGLDLSLDSYPYLPGSTTLSALLPGWAHAGGPAALLARLAAEESAARIRTVLEVDGSDGCHGVPVDWSTIEVSGVRDAALAGWIGRRLDDPPPGEPGGFASARRLLLADRLGTTILQHVGHEENVQAIMRHPAHTGGSDGILRGDRPHPRAFGTFPQFFARYVRELGVLSLEECTARLTGRPARRLRLPDRGLIRPGHRADLVLFDPDRIAPGATYQAPRTPPTGVHHVLVDGRFAIRDGRRTQVVAGRSVRGGRPSGE